MPRRGCCYGLTHVLISGMVSRTTVFSLSRAQNGVHSASYASHSFRISIITFATRTRIGILHFRRENYNTICARESSGHHSHDCLRRAKRIAFVYEIISRTRTSTSLTLYSREQLLG